MIWRRPWIWLLVAFLHGTPTQAQVGDPCGQLFLPEGYQLICRVHTDARGWQLVVQPEEGAFASLSKLTLRPVDERVTDPKAWLRDQLIIDLSGFESTLDDLLHGDDSPLAGTSLEDAFEGWQAFMSRVSTWPLDGCEEPEKLVGDDAWQMACEWQFHDWHQYLALRLVERDGQQHFIKIQAMNPRRYRHLQAIARSF